MVFCPGCIMSSLKKTNKKQQLIHFCVGSDECKKEYKRRQEYKENMRFEQIG